MVPCIPGDNIEQIGHYVYNTRLVYHGVPIMRLSKISSVNRHLRQRQQQRRQQRPQYDLNTIHAASFRETNITR